MPTIYKGLQFSKTYTVPPGVSSDPGSQTAPFPLMKCNAVRERALTANNLSLPEDRPQMKNKWLYTHLTLGLLSSFGNLSLSLQRPDRYCNQHFCEMNSHSWEYTDLKPDLCLQGTSIWEQRLIDNLVYFYILPVLMYIVKNQSTNISVKMYWCQIQQKDENHLACPKQSIRKSIERPLDLNWLTIGSI